MKKFLTAIFVLTLALPAMAQSGKYGHGQDSIDCVKYLSYYKEDMKNNNMDEALPRWRKAFSVCPPTASQNMLIDGQKLLRYAIGKCKDATQRAAIVDSLINLHDLRAQYYPKYVVTANVNKGVDIINYKWHENNPQEVLDAYASIVGIAGTQTSPAIFVNYFKVAADLYKDGKYDAEKVMDLYTSVSELMDKALSEKAEGQMAGAKQDVETLFADCGVASCDNLVSLFAPRYAANPEDEAVFNTVVKLLGKAECFDTELYLNAVQSLHRMKPSAETGYYLYKLLASQGKDVEAATALEEAVSLATENVGQAADYSLELGTFYFKKVGNNPKAVSAAKKAIELNEAIAAKGYLLLGTIWGSLGCSGNEIETRAKYWVAYDFLQKAKAADPSLTDEVNNLAGQYRQYFPQQADAFMYDVIDGQQYTVNCGGLRESTTVRTQK